MSMDQEAAVIAIIDGQKRVLICKRAEHLRTHPGEACLAGGKQEEGDTSIVDTALREAEEEIGVNRELITIQYELEPITSLGGMWVHTVVGTVAEEPELSINTNEVAKTEWIPLELFLNDENHWNVLNGNYNVHVFDFPQLRVFGLTANLCILIAIKELGLAPDFDLNPVLTTSVMQSLTPAEILSRFFEYYYENVRPRADRETAKM